MTVCYIVGAGDFSEGFTPSDCDLVIAADGGFDHLKKRGIRCDLCIGDFDSVTSLPTGCEILRFPVKKDETDMHLAFIEGYKRGYRSFKLYGGTGGRNDHTFANYSLLLYGKEQNSDITLIGDRENSFVIKNERISLTARRGATLSVFALGGDAKGVSIIGACYEAKDIDLSPSFPLGVSNSFLDGTVEIEVKDGALLIMIEK